MCRGSLNPLVAKPVRRARLISNFRMRHHAGKAAMKASHTAGDMSALISLHWRQANTVTCPPCDAGTT
jgi:hypothetical protein